MKAFWRMDVFSTLQGGESYRVRAFVKTDETVHLKPLYLPDCKLRFNKR